MLLEICVDNFQSAINAEKGGADRIELCAALSEDGLTPSIGFAKQCVEQLSIPVFAMIRPRSGDFCYTPEEVQIMMDDIHHMKSIGVHGLVMGVLRKDRQIDEVVMKQLVQAAKPLPITFHRAFDITPDPYSALNTLINLQIDRVLTSGQQAKAIDGISLLSELVQQSDGRIIIMPGAGINRSNIKMLLSSGASEYHGSARTNPSNISDVEEIEAIKHQLH